jgi:hypothetical protein
MGLVTLTGGLSLARMRPFLEVAGTLFLAEIDDIVAACIGSKVPGCAAEVASLERWRSEIGVLEDASTPGYFQSTAAGVAILVASRESTRSDREWRIRSSVGNFWASCDDLLHAGGGYSKPDFKGVKTTLQGVEDIWRDGDIRSLGGASGSIVDVYSERLRKIRSSYPMRRRIARVVAECAGWESPGVPL